ncbi:hypothetical protein GOP47_0024606 [Adiantum capillus-veneris]|uniref:Uncharacterized protein n=1 Tax=Adiantum capillus-veneris TaxID=13818 RepID=A0A9D4U221_ADICA|nr:hypothetical protein GOP47_0024606 [Adiantum capillus-veneris]
MVGDSCGFIGLTFRGIMRRSPPGVVVALVSVAALWCFYCSFVLSTVPGSSKLFSQKVLGTALANIRRIAKISDEEILAKSSRKDVVEPSSKAMPCGAPHLGASIDAKSWQWCLALQKNRRIIPC